MKPSFPVQQPGFLAQAFIGCAPAVNRLELSMQGPNLIDEELSFSVVVKVL